MTGTGTLGGPVGLVGAGYIGHLFAQQFALAGCEVRAWSPGESTRTLHDRLRQSLSALAEIGAVVPSDIDGVIARVSAHDELEPALASCSAVMKAIVEDADAKAACCRDVEAMVGSDVLLWSATSKFPHDSPRRRHAPSRAGGCGPSRADAADHLRRGRRRGAHQ